MSDILLYLFDYDVKGYRSRGVLFVAVAETEARSGLWHSVSISTTPHARDLFQPSASSCGVNSRLPRFSSEEGPETISICVGGMVRNLGDLGRAVFGIVIPTNTASPARKEGT
jgi:hypothetical protein